MTAAPPEQHEPRQGRVQLVRDSLLFQLKLFVDGMRDLVFSPISLILTALDVLTGGQRFYRLLELGRRSESWINLFGTHDRTGLDESVERLEQLLTEEYRKGDISASARSVMRRALDNVAKFGAAPPPPATPPDEDVNRH